MSAETLVMNPKVNFYFEKESPFQNEIQLLRQLCLATLSEEHLKWGVPCYSLDKRNIVMIHCFKNYCALLFLKGAVMKDEEKLLIQQTEHTRAARQLRFKDIAQIKAQENIILKYLNEAIIIEKAGLRVDIKSMPVAIAEEFQSALDQDETLKNNFYRLTPGRQREYLIFFKSAKQAKTRENRIAKNMDKIKSGKGLTD